MNLAWLTGRMSEREMLAEHPLELARLRPPEPPPTPPPPAPEGLPAPPPPPGYAPQGYGRPKYDSDDRNSDEYYRKHGYHKKRKSLLGEIFDF